MRHPSMHAVRGLTLLETVITVALIGALLAIAVPAFGRLMSAARSSVCSSNLRQLHVATTAYANVHNGHLPAAVLHFVVPGGVRTEAWDAALLPGGTLGDGPLSTFIDRVDGIRQCPEHHGPSNWGNDDFSGYAYNTSYLGAEGAFPYFDEHGTLVDGWKAARRGVPVGAQRRTAETALFSDAGFSGGANRFMRAPSNAVELNLGLVYAGGQAFRHGGGCNVVHLDGHCSVCEQPRRGMHATEPLLSILGYPHNGFLSDDDEAYDPR